MVIKQHTGGNTIHGPLPFNNHCPESCMSEGKRKREEICKWGSVNQRKFLPLETNKTLTLLHSFAHAWTCRDTVEVPHVVFILCKWRCQPLTQLYITYDFQENVDLGELMFSLCYLPTAGRLTITMIKARNLKAMDITGASGGFRKHSGREADSKLLPNNPRVITTTAFPWADPYVKVSLMCEGRRLKKRKTSTKRNTLNPVYNEAIVFDVPPENIDQISLLIAVMDYDRLVLEPFLFPCSIFTQVPVSMRSFLDFRVGHNEVIGVCKVGNEAESLGRDHWSEMLTYPRKPIARWHPLIEVRTALFWARFKLSPSRRAVKPWTYHCRSEPTAQEKLNSANFFNEKSMTVFLVQAAKQNMFTSKCFPTKSAGNSSL